jgi:hypothetical protein
MATPNIAGSAALLRQYFIDGRHHGTIVEPLGSLMKAVLINSADPPDVNEKSPNVVTGFGALNLGEWLPFDTDTFSMIIGNGIPIGRRQHLVSSVRVTGKTKDLWVTISSFDNPASPDSWIPLFADLDLIVVGPDNTIYQGNHRPDKSEEHFSTTERVIVWKSELVVGIYEIHVISALHNTVSQETFSIVAVGDIDGGNGYLNFAPATACVAGCGDGECDSTTFTCKCAKQGEVGEFCQQEAINVTLDSEPVHVSVDSLGIEYLSFQKPAGVAGALTVWVNLTTSVQTDDYWQFLLGGSQEPEGSAWAYDGNCSDPCEITINLGTGTTFASGLLRSNSPVHELFEVWASFKEEPPKEEPSGLSGGAIAGIVIGSVALVVVVIVVIVIVCRRGDDVDDALAST